MPGCLTWSGVVLGQTNSTQSAFGPIFLLVVTLCWLAIFTYLVVFIARRYKRCLPDQALVVSGRVGGDAAHKVLLGGGAFVYPVIQDYSYLSLKPVKASVVGDVQPGGEGSAERVVVRVTAAVGTEKEQLETAAMRLIGLPEAEVLGLVEEALTQAVASSVWGLGDDVGRAEIEDAVGGRLADALAKLGMIVLSCAVECPSRVRFEKVDQTLTAEV
ncbi:MAG: hypothetical protein AAF797_12655 [Planctomycetota bacterium]